VAMSGHISSNGGGSGGGSGFLPDSTDIESKIAWRRYAPRSGARRRWAMGLEPGDDALGEVEQGDRTR
jgi:hypothetical protein